MADVALVYLGTLNPLTLIDGISIIKAGKNSNFIMVHSNNLIPYKGVLISNEAFVIGYPTSIGTPENPQIDYEQPLLRKGIVAGKNDKNKSIILDCPVYQGNSGGLAMQMDEANGRRNFQIIGLVTEFIPFFEKMYSLHHHYQNLNLENSGYSVVVPSDHMLDVIRTKFTLDKKEEDIPLVSEAQPPTPKGHQI